MTRTLAAAVAIVLSGCSEQQGTVSEPTSETLSNRQEPIASATLATGNVTEFTAVEAAGVENTAQFSKPSQQYVTRRDDGYVTFFVGHAVRKRMLAENRFEPKAGDWYGEIQVPDRLIPAVGAGPVTVSLCDRGVDVSVEYHRFVGQETAKASRDPDSQVLRYTDDGEEIEHFRAGDSGIYGRLQVSWTSSGELSVGVSAQYLLQWGKSPALTRNGGMSIGALIFDDQELDDPILQAGGCVCDQAGC
jgi:hypothetical protein